MSETQTTPDLKDVLSKKVRTTGNEIPDGTYPATLAGYSKPWWQDQTKSKFYTEGDPKTRLMIRANFGITVKNGALEAVGFMFPVPNGEAHRKSNAYKFMKALVNNNPEFIDKEGNFTDATDLQVLIGKTATISIKTNDKGFPQVEAVNMPIDGLKYPTAEDVKKLDFGESEKIPF